MIFNLFYLRPSTRADIISLIITDDLTQSNNISVAPMRQKVLNAIIQKMCQNVTAISQAENIVKLSELHKLRCYINLFYVFFSKAMNVVYIISTNLVYSNSNYPFSTIDVLVSSQRGRLCSSRMNAKVIIDL